MGGTNRRQRGKPSPKTTDRSITGNNHKSRRASLSPPISSCEESTSSISTSSARPAHPPSTPMHLTSRQRIEIARFRSILQGKNLVMEKPHVQEVSSTLYKHRLMEQWKMANELRSTLEKYADQALAATKDASDYCTRENIADAPDSVEDCHNNDSDASGVDGKEISENNNCHGRLAENSTVAETKTAVARVGIRSTSEVGIHSSCNDKNGRNSRSDAEKIKIVLKSTNHMHELAALTEAVQAGYTLDSYDQYQQLYEKKRKRKQKEVDKAKKVIEDHLDRMVLEESSSLSKPYTAVHVNERISIQQQQQTQLGPQYQPQHQPQRKKAQKLQQQQRPQRQQQQQLQRHQSLLRKKQQETHQNQYLFVTSQQAHQIDVQKQQQSNKAAISSSTKVGEGSPKRNRNIAVKVITGPSKIMLTAPKNFTDKVCGVKRPKGLPLTKGKEVQAVGSTAKSKAVLLKKPPQQPSPVKKTNMLFSKKTSDNGNVKAKKKGLCIEISSLQVQKQSAEILAKTPISSFSKKRTLQEMEGSSTRRAPDTPDKDATVDGSKPSSGTTGRKNNTASATPSPSLGKKNNTNSAVPSPALPVLKERKCHVCKEMVSKFRRCNYYNPSGVKCSRAYCFKCLEEYEGKPRLESNGLTDDTEWHCPACLGTCRCQSCLKMLQKMRMKRSTRASRHVPR